MRWLGSIAKAGKKAVRSLQAKLTNATRKFKRSYEELKGERDKNVDKITRIQKDNNDLKEQCGAHNAKAKSLQLASARMASKLKQANKRHHFFTSRPTTCVCANNARTRTHTHVHFDTHTRTRAHTRTHVRARTHTQVQIQEPALGSRRGALCSQEAGCSVPGDGKRQRGEEDADAQGISEP